MLFSKKKFLAEIHIFGCIKSMLNFIEVESDSHKEQCEKLELAEKAWTENILLSSNR